MGWDGIGSDWIGRDSVDDGRSVLLKEGQISSALHVERPRKHSKQTLGEQDVGRTRSSRCQEWTTQVRIPEMYCTVQYRTVLYSTVPFIAPDSGLGATGRGESRVGAEQIVDTRTSSLDR